VGTFALLETIVESITSPKPSPVGEGAELARRMRCLLSNVYVFLVQLSYFIFGEKLIKSLPLEGKVPSLSRRMRCSRRRYE
jgi:hypothetical protein